MNDVSHCSIETASKPIFYFSDTSDPNRQPWYENLRLRGNQEAEVLGQLSIGSMVEVGDSSVENVGTRNYTYIRVKRHSTYRQRLTQRLMGAVRGFLFGRSVKAPDRWKLIVDDSHVEGVGNSRDETFFNDKTLIATKTSSGFPYLNCCQDSDCQNIPIFSVFEDVEEDPVAYVASRPEDLAFIREMTPMRNRQSRSTPEDSSDESSSTSIASDHDGHSHQDPEEGIHGQSSTTVNLDVEEDEEPSSHAVLTSPRPMARPENLIQVQEFIDGLTFPVTAHPTRDFTTGIRRFGASRSGGRRKHAGCDLYRPRGERVVAVRAGRVLRRYAFYLGTYAVEVLNEDGTIYRYGEVTGRQAAGIEPGSTVHPGQTVGYVGKMTGIRNTMLHFEKYSGTGAGALTQRSIFPFQRRRDLQDPTSLLVSLAEQGGFR